MKTDYRMTLIQCVFFVCLILSGVTAASDIQGNKSDANLKIVIDNDAGGDDATALFLALLHEKHMGGIDILAVTTVHGNVHESQSCTNTKRILKLAQRQEVPLHRGAKEALLHSIKPDGYFGEDGLGDTNEILTDLVPERSAFAAMTLIELSKVHEGELVVITLGPVTNIALAMKLDPEFLGRLKQLYVGAGHVHNERHSKPEYNALCDVEAYRILLQNASPDLVTVLPYSQTKNYLDIPNEWRNEILGGINNKIMKSMNKFERLFIEKNPFWYPLDPALVACVIREDLIKEIRYSKQDIAICGDDRGMTSNEFVDVKDANVKMIYSIDQEAYKKFLIDVFSAEQQS